MNALPNQLSQARIEIGTKGKIPLEGARTIIETVEDSIRAARRHARVNMVPPGAGGPTQMAPGPTPTAGSVRRKSRD